MHIGRVQELPVWFIGDTGILLGDRRGHVILPLREDPGGLSKGDKVKVFVTTDTHDQVTATRALPKAQVGELAMMTVVGEHGHGVFVDWGLPKDLFIPWKHQHQRLQMGDTALVYVALDERDRPVGWTKLVDLLVAPTAALKVGQPLRLLVYGENDAGVLCAVNGRWSGILYHDLLDDRDVKLRVGDALEGFLERVRDDGKLDLSLVPVGRDGALHAVDVVWRALEAAGGSLPLNDDSPPELVRERLGLSKKVFKKALGALYRERKVILDEAGVRVAPQRPRRR